MSEASLEQAESLPSAAIFSYQYRLLRGGFPRLRRHLCRLVPHYGGVGCDKTQPSYGAAPATATPHPVSPGQRQDEQQDWKCHLISIALLNVEMQPSPGWDTTGQPSDSASSTTQSGRKRQERRAG